jgi:hypothetical protein
MGFSHHARGDLGVAANQGPKPAPVPTRLLRLQKSCTLLMSSPSKGLNRKALGAHISTNHKRCILSPDSRLGLLKSLPSRHNPPIITPARIEQVSARHTINLIINTSTEP